MCQLLTDLSHIYFYITLPVSGNGGNKCTNVPSEWESDTSIERCPQEDWTVQAVAAFYLLFSNLLLVNLVIAMFRWWLFVKFKDKRRFISNSINRCSVTKNDQFNYIWTQPNPPTPPKKMLNVIDTAYRVIWAPYNLRPLFTCKQCRLLLNSYSRFLIKRMRFISWEI